MPVDGKLRPGEVLDDPDAVPGMVTIAETVTSGRMPTPIDPDHEYMRGSSAESCALFGGSKGSAHAIKPGTKGQP